LVERKGRRGGGEQGAILGTLSSSPRKKKKRGTDFSSKNHVEKEGKGRKETGRDAIVWLLLRGGEKKKSRLQLNEKVQNMRGKISSFFFSPQRREGQAAPFIDHRGKKRGGLGRILWRNFWRKGVGL